MKQETGVAICFWTMLICGLLFVQIDKSVEASIFIAAAAIIAVISLNAKVKP